MGPSCRPAIRTGAHAEGALPHPPREMGRRDPYISPIPDALAGLAEDG
jgi:hypothetical protein